MQLRKLLSGKVQFNSVQTYGRKLCDSMLETVSGSEALGLSFI
jgi:hypothetical protein